MVGQPLQDGLILVGERARPGGATYSKPSTRHRSGSAPPARRPYAPLGEGAVCWLTRDLARSRRCGRGVQSPAPAPDPLASSIRTP